MWSENFSHELLIRPSALSAGPNQRWRRRFVIVAGIGRYAAKRNDLDWRMRKSCSPRFRKRVRLPRIDASPDYLGREFNSVNLADAALRLLRNYRLLTAPTYCGGPHGSPLTPSSQDEHRHNQRTWRHRSLLIHNSTSLQAQNSAIPRSPNLQGTALPHPSSLILQP